MLTGRCGAPPLRRYAPPPAAAASSRLDAAWELGAAPAQQSAKTMLLSAYVMLNKPLGSRLGSWDMRGPVS